MDAAKSSLWYPPPEDMRKGGWWPSMEAMETMESPEEGIRLGGVWDALSGGDRAGGGALEGGDDLGV
jgi:hypothetical protein